LSKFNRKNYILRLKDIIQVPDQTNNLISLGRWDKNGGTYTDGKGKIILTTNDGDMHRNPLCVYQELTYIFLNFI